MNKAVHKPVLIIIAGPNGSGKTSVTSKILNHQWLEDSIYINPDNIAQVKFGDWNNDESVLKAAQFATNLRYECLENKQSHIFETVFSANEKIDFVVKAKEAGFFIRFFLISTSHPSINASRVAKRVIKGGHDVPINKIISRYFKCLANSKVIINSVDRFYVYDNSEEDVDAKLLFRLSNGKLIKQYTEELPDWAKDLLP